MRKSSQIKLNHKDNLSLYTLYIVSHFCIYPIDFLKIFTFILIPVDIPDPYVIVSIHTSPHAEQRTRAIDNDINPVWNETFKFYLHPHAKNELGKS